MKQFGELTRIGRKRRSKKIIELALKQYKMGVSRLVRDAYGQIRTLI